MGTGGIFNSPSTNTSQHNTQNHHAKENVVVHHNQSSSTSNINNVNNEKLANIADTCIGKGAALKYKSRLKQLQKSSNTVNISGDANVVSQINQNIKTAFKGINLNQGQINCMQKELVDFGKTTGKQKSDTKGGDVTSKTDTDQTAKQSSSSSQKAKANSCDSGGLIHMAGCVGSGAGRGGITIITIILFYLFFSKNKKNKLYKKFCLNFIKKNIFFSTIIYIYNGFFKRKC